VVPLESVDQLKDLVRRGRRGAGLSQCDLAKKAGVGKTLIFDLEKGHEKIQLDKLLAILRVLKIEMKFLAPPVYEEEKGARYL